MIAAIVTDIEGTTSSLSFVKDVLFPYARARMAEFVRTRATEPAVRKELDAVRGLAGKDLGTEELVAQLIRWIDEDKKVTPLKALQGMIWEDGYKKGDFKGHMYEDAVRNLRRWQAQGIRLYVFSSGSVQAQKLLFGYSDFGDLTPLFSGYFDTTIGNKREAEAYRKIVAAIGLPPVEILFLSDIREELDAARAAGMQTLWLVRDGALDPAAAHRQIRNFDAISVTN
ncbi:MAG: 2,3-diketo-5-methylthio-1-phosphopentane phosphatase [Candidatus Muproteobacteria bacterium RBG_16_65_34]|uniref:Enolase-phosphatase E1 n=1 Tax=Candidatus Muproteobacteria bacterium RBG_16_65_34 TaxID=1817760 RepID=A0A1F6TMR1_9PROT|nr:MAG: 2,3-diketo-5-methylthio-1-phosphopentane phosphatase [Candidatus Muproteobacteria bacterium RBG_16_65_34]